MRFWAAACDAFFAWMTKDGRRIPVLVAESPMKNGHATKWVF